MGSRPVVAGTHGRSAAGPGLIEHAPADRIFDEFTRGFGPFPLGREYVDRSLADVDEFNAAMQTLVTEYCWGEIWCRTGLDCKTRSIINLAMLTALNRPHELHTHVRGALNNGVTVDEIKEALIHATIYCGIPAGLDAFKVANEVLKEVGAIPS
jgi:4-carboxymuconolactone decarboxylase